MDQPPSASGVLPTGMRERVLAASWQARPAGQPEPEPAGISPAEAFRRATDALDALLGTLGDDDWSVPVLRDLDVQGLVGHLIGVEEDVHRCLSGDPGVAATTSGHPPAAGAGLLSPRTPEPGVTPDLRRRPGDPPDRGRTSGGAPADLDLDITGDPGRAASVLAAAAALALD